MSEAKKQTLKQYNEPSGLSKLDKPDTPHNQVCKMHTWKKMPK